MRKFLLVFSVLALVTMAVLELTYKDGPEPDEVYPMANQHIEWTN